MLIEFDERTGQVELSGMELILLENKLEHRHVLLLTLRQHFVLQMTLHVEENKFMSMSNLPL